MLVRRPSTFNTFHYLKFNFYVRQSVLFFRSDNINYTYSYSINTINTSTEQAKPDLSMNNATIERVKSEFSMNTSSTEQTNSNLAINQTNSDLIKRKTSEIRVPETSLEAEETTLIKEEETYKKPKLEEIQQQQPPPSGRKKYTTAKDRREHKTKNFKNRHGNRLDEDIKKKSRTNDENNNNDNKEIELKNEINENGDDKVNDEKKEPRKPKKKVAVLLGFCGTGYQGMQINRNAKTIEEELFKAFVAAVDIPDVVEKINEHLPEQIRVWGFVKTIRSFHAKTLCDSRIYEYLIPTYVFVPYVQSSINQTEKNLKKEINLSNINPDIQKENFNNSLENCSDIQQESNKSSNIRRIIEVPLTTSEEMIEKRKYRIPSETLDYVRQCFKAYEGTHNFHNFTIGRNPKERSCNRFITSFEVCEPKIINNCEWLSLKVHGQSFMLHQIRKMVALIVMMVRTTTPVTLIPRTFDPIKINIPKAPALGLLLEQPVFKSYNKKCMGNGKGLIEFEKHQIQEEEFTNNT
ncbi:2889_t:CDS:2 [Diversispora eburnea]|uniref:2889_t:CDS:1 n=1 Tax=Diversispora eburnea TaxID=1213867 RepID=A0A9N8YXA4_9GLOM|nr:2889_t:CDS:2 [Diversispora eburnea]